MNPVAGRGRAGKIWPQVEKVLSSRRALSVTFTRQAGETTALAKQAVAEGFKQIIAVGGDGTVNEVVNGIIGAPVEFGLIPLGTGNDFARTLGLPKDPLRAAQVILGGVTRQVDVGYCAGKHFVNVAGVGFDAMVAQLANREMRFLKGTAAYVASVFATLFTFSPIPVTLTIDGQQRIDQVWLVALANGRYFGGGMKITPQAEPDDNQLDICLVGTLSKLALLRFFPTVFSGKHVHNKAVTMLRGHTVTVESAKPLPMQVDGEVLAHTPVTVTLCPHALRVIVPPF